MLVCNNQLLLDLEAKLPASEITKSRLVMVIYYLLRERLDSNHGSFENIINRINELVESGNLVLNERGNFKIAKSYV